jgi:hypothetical protein
MRSFYKRLLLVFFGMGLAGNAFAQKSDSSYYRPASRILFQSDFEDAALDPLHARSGRAALRVQNKSVRIARLAVRRNEKVYVRAWVQFENKSITQSAFSGLPLATPLYANPASVEAIPFVPANPFVWVEAGRQLREALAPKPQATLEVKFFTQKQDLLYTQTQAIQPGKGWQEVVVANQMPQDGNIEVSLLNPGSRMLWADDVVVLVKDNGNGSGLDTLRATNGCHCPCGFVDPGSCECNACGGTEPDLGEPPATLPTLPGFPASGFPSPSAPPGGGADNPETGETPGGGGGGGSYPEPEPDIEAMLAEIPWNLNEAERKLYTEQPELIPAAIKNYALANLEVKARFPNTFSQDDNNANAFKHAYFAALNAKSVGADNAKAMGDAHEDYPGNDYWRKLMDTSNNNVGIAIQTLNENADNGELSELIYKSENLQKLNDEKNNLIKATNEDT